MSQPPLDLVSMEALLSLDCNDYYINTYNVFFICVFYYYCVKEFHLRTRIFRRCEFCGNYGTAFASAVCVGSNTSVSVCSHVSPCNQMRNYLQFRTSTVQYVLYEVVKP